ncbi:MAG: hypothetical protein ACLTSX_14710 [Collinsella sp.]
MGRRPQRDHRLVDPGDARGHRARRRDGRRACRLPRGRAAGRFRLLSATSKHPTETNIEFLLDTLELYTTRRRMKTAQARLRSNRPCRPMNAGSLRSRRRETPRASVSSSRPSRASPTRLGSREFEVIMIGRHDRRRRPKTAFMHRICSDAAISSDRRV